MEFLQPATWEEALAMKPAHPEAVPIAGGTDVMVEINLDHRRPETVIDLTPIRELTEWGMDDGRLRIGAGVSYTRLIDELGDRLPGLAIASRTVGSPQIRNRGTVGGNLGTASPAGDAHPPLLAADAFVELASASGSRRVPVREFFTGPKRNAMRKDELIAAFLVEPAPGPQQFSKVGTRNAMVIAVCSFALALDPGRRRVGTGIGSAGPTPLRAVEAESFLQSELDWEGRRPPSDATLNRFGELVAAAAKPIDAVLSRSWRAGVLSGRGRHEYQLRGQRRYAGGRRRLAGRKPPVRFARAIRSLRIEERLRARRVRFVLGVSRRHSRLCVPRPGWPGQRSQDCHGRRARRAGRAASYPARLRRRGRGAVRLLHARADRGRARSAAAHPATVRRADPRG